MMGENYSGGWGGGASGMKVQACVIIAPNACNLTLTSPSTKMGIIIRFLNLSAMVNAVLVDCLL